jgi:predicted esterase
VLLDDVRGGAPGAPLLISCHGYAQSAEDALAEARKIPNLDRWTIAAVQGLHRFYTRGDERVVASWMTREDREIAIADNVAYMDRAVDAIREATAATGPVVFVGFSQGAGMAYRAALLGAHTAAAIVALGGDVPPDVKASSVGRQWPPVFVGVGDREAWYSPAKVQTDLAFFDARRVTHEVARFAGGHEWTDEFRAAASAWIAKTVR